MVRRALIGLTLLSTVASAQRQETLDRLTIVAPAAPGGGWDQTARAMQRALEDEGLVRTACRAATAALSGNRRLADDPFHETDIGRAAPVRCGSHRRNCHPASLENAFTVLNGSAGYLPMRRRWRPPDLARHEAAGQFKVIRAFRSLRLYHQLAVTQGPKDILAAVQTAEFSP